ncbi:MAG: TetR/AcrR family transcriptional regulator [Myxococcota bacterium]|jgi:AcrR family transcriptional regulator|nr:TetR/AcrR family transcriptional regulator [Myxococcota bacterium]
MAPIATSRELPQLPSQKERAELRRRQLVAIADALLEEGGVEAVSMARVAEIAGCARTLVYRYFPTREELLGAVVELFYERLDEITAEAELEQTSAAGTNGEDSGVAFPGSISELWDALWEGGLGGAVLRTTPFVSAELQSLMETMIARHERRFSQPLEASGLTEQQAKVVMDSLNASFTNLLLRARRGEITREQGIELYRWLARGLLQGIRINESTQSGVES